MEIHLEIRKRSEQCGLRLQVPVHSVLLRGPVRRVVAQSPQVSGTVMSQQRSWTQSNHNKHSVYKLNKRLTLASGDVGAEMLAMRCFCLLHYRMCRDLVLKDHVSQRPAEFMMFHHTIWRKLGDSPCSRRFAVAPFLLITTKL